MTSFLTSPVLNINILECLHLIVMVDFRPIFLNLEYYPTSRAVIVPLLIFVPAIINIAQIPALTFEKRVSKIWPHY